MSIIFNTQTELDYYVLNYMRLHNEYTLYVYLRCGYSTKEMSNSSFEIEPCCIYYGDNAMNYQNEYGESISWWNDWHEGESFIEVKSIITESELEQMADKHEVIEQ